MDVFQMSGVFLMQLNESWHKDRPCRQGIPEYLEYKYSVQSEN